MNLHYIFGSPIIIEIGKYFSGAEIQKLFLVNKQLRNIVMQNDLFFRWIYLKLVHDCEDCLKHLINIETKLQTTKYFNYHQCRVKVSQLTLNRYVIVISSNGYVT